MTRIETGVDKLVKLVAKEKKIELHDAAKRLNVDPAVVQEWAEFLEEEGIVGLQYSLRRTYVVEKRLSSTEVKKKGKEYDNKKEAFVRRVDVALKNLENESSGFENIKKEYESVKDHIGDEIGEVKEEIDQLRHYEEIKRSIDQDILKQRVEYQKTVDELRTRLAAEEKRYNKLLKDVGEEAKKLEIERSEFTDIKKEEGDLLNRIDALKDIVKTVHTRIESQSHSIDAHEHRLGTLKELAETLRDDLVTKRQKEIEPLLKISNDQSSRILRIQEEVVEKVKKSRGKMQEFETESKEIADRFERFFEKRSHIEQLIKELDKAKIDMKEQLNDLIGKAKAFEITTKGADANKHIAELEGKFKDFDRRRGAFVSQLDNLRNFILGKKVSEKKVKETEKELKKPLKLARKTKKPPRVVKRKLKKKIKKTKSTKKTRKKKR